MNKEKLLSWVFGRGTQTIPYEKYAAKVTGSINSAILLQQMSFRGGLNEKRSFYKFIEPCNHPLYRIDDSWTEELGMTITQFRNARDLIATRARTVEERDEFLQNTDLKFCVVYITDRDNVTHWFVNDAAVYKVMEKCAEMFADTQRRIEEQNRNLAKQANMISRNEETSFPPYNKEELTYKKNITASFFSEESKPDVRTAEEPVKTTPVKQKNLIKFDKYAKKMPIDFSLEFDILENAENLGYETQDITDEGVKYVHYYTNGKGTNTRYRDWNHQFIYGWLDNGYKKGYLKRNGQFYKLDANTERRESIKKLTDPDFFAHITED